jgi:hypothetical protein
MAPKHHPTPLSGGDRKALNKELGKARAMTNILAAQSVETRNKGESLIRTADKLLCESWNERMWADGEPINPSPSVDQAINGRYAFLTTEPNAEVSAVHPKAMPVVLTTPEEVETRMTAPPDEALKLQRPLPDGALRIVARGVKEDPAGPVA